MSLPYIDTFSISKLYGTTPPEGYTYSAGLHAGIDLVGAGDKTIVAVQGGKVIRSSYDADGWGNYLVIEGDDGLNYIYCHLSVKDKAIGDVVKAYDAIGTEGATGMVTGSHLHLEIRTDYSDIYSTINPATQLGIEEIVGQAITPGLPANQPSAWAESAWVKAYEAGILDGTSPRNSLTREQLAAVLERLDLI